MQVQLRRLAAIHSADVPVLRLLIALMGCVLLALAACASSAKTNSSAYSTTVACSGSVISSAGHYRLACPVGWTVTTSPTVPDEMRITTRNQLAGMVISSVVGRITASQYGTLLQARVAATGTTNITTTSNPTPIKFGSRPWMMTAAGTGTRGTTDFMLEQYTTFQDGARYLVESYAPAKSPPSMRKMMSAMLASLTFQ